MTGDGLPRSTWETLLAEVDTTTFGELVAVLEERDTDMLPADPETVVDAAIDDGPLVEDPDAAGAFPEYRLAGDERENAGSGAASDNATPGGRGPETAEEAAQDRADSGKRTESDDGGTWSDADFTSPRSGAWPTSLLEREQWMGHVEKRPFAPWGDRDADLECTKARCRDHDSETPEAGVAECEACQAHQDGVSTAECDHDARYKWGHAGHYVDGERVGMAEVDQRLDGRAFLQQADDPFMFVDGDDVRDPETGDVHPVFVDLLERFGVTYADVSTSGSGAHAYYRGELPERVKEATFAIDDEPWGANDDVPEVEIYDGKHVCVATGAHVSGTPLSVRTIDDEALEAVLEEYDELPDTPDPRTEREAFDAEGYDPDATGADETTEDLRDVFAALDALDARAVADKTIVRRWLDPPGTENRAFVPAWAPSGYDGTANFANERAWTDSGTHGGYGGPACLAAIDCSDLSIDETDCPNDPEGEDWFRAVEHLRDLGFDVPEYVGGGSGSGEGDDDRDPREIDVTPDAEVAWKAAGAVVPTDLDVPLPLETGVEDDTAGWMCPVTGEHLDVVRAVAVADGLADTGAEPLEGDTYHDAYTRAREVYGAPLPRYVTTEDATASFDVLLAAIRECGFHHLDREAIRSDVTAEGDDVGGDAVLALDPAWRPSESGESVLVFPSGTIWDADTETTLDVVRFVALECGLLGGPEQRLEGERFTESVRRAREEYRAPIPQWHTGTPDGHVPLLPPADELLEEARLEDVDELQEARDAVEELYRGLASGHNTDRPAVLSALPGLGKTTAVMKAATDRPTTYLAPRKELQADAMQKAEAEGADARHLPVMGGDVREEVLTAAVEHVREHGKDRLRDRWSILSEATDGGGVFADESEADDEEDVDLERPTCGCAEGDHGDDWALVVHVARELGYTPRDIHTRDRALFGTTLPCSEDGPCAYTEGWDAVSDPDNPPDLLIGHYVHAYVESARTYYTRSPNGTVNRAPRAVVLDEFPGVDTFADEYGREAFDHAAWLAGALREDVTDIRDVDQTDLWSDEYVRAWLEGEGDDLAPVADLCAALDARADLLEAQEAAGRVLAAVDDEKLEASGLKSPLQALHDGDDADLAVRADALRSTLATLESQPERDLSVPPWVLSTINDDILAPLAAACDTDREAATDALETLGVGAELRTLVEGAITAGERGQDGAAGRLRAAKRALQGGDDGVRELAVWSDDGWAHPDAHDLLRGCITPTGPDAPGDARRIETSEFDFGEDGDDGGTTLDYVTHGRRTTLVDRNLRGAAVHAPPSRTAGNGDDAPLVGLDATAEADLWSLVLGERVETRDIHDTVAQRRRFLRDVLGLQVVQVGEEARPYEGNPEGKDLDGDIELLRELRDRYTGVKAARTRDGEPLGVGRPACITTKVVREHLEADDRLTDAVSAWDNYGNVTGDNDLGEHTLAAILGTQHYGHAAVEYLAALGGEEARPSGRGINLQYGSDLADAYLRHMREDQLMQAALRFTRGGTGALVVCRTSAVPDALPVVGEGRVATTWSETATTLASEWRRLEGETFTVGDLADRVDVTRRHVRRVLAELADAGYLERVREGDGVATEYADAGPTPAAAEYDLPDATPPRQEPHTESYTANVRVADGETLPDRPQSRPGPVLPAPDALAEGDPPG